MGRCSLGHGFYGEGGWGGVRVEKGELQMREVLDPCYVLLIFGFLPKITISPLFNILF